MDVLSWLPYFLPVFFPSGTVAFGMIRIVRIFRLFRIDAYYDSLHVITQVIYGKRQQLISSVVLILISFLGVGMVAISTGIISAGFVDIYASIKRRNEYGYEADMHFIKVHIEEGDKWLGKRIADLSFPSGLLVAIIKRDDEIIIPRGDVIIMEDDMVVLGAIPYEEDENEHFNLKEIVLKRRNKSLIPNGNMMLEAGDRVFLYTKLHLAEANTIEI